MGKPLGLGLNLDVITKNQDKISEMKEKMYDEYDPLSSRREKGGRKDPEDIDVHVPSQPTKPKFNLPVKGLGGSGFEGTADDV